LRNFASVENEMKELTLSEADGKFRLLDNEELVTVIDPQKI